MIVNPLGKKNSSVNKSYKKLSSKADLVYSFVCLYNQYIHSSHNYGGHYNFTMMEIHTLSYVEDNPGITSTELAKMWHKTKSAVSQTVKKLVEHGYLMRQTTDSNNKTVHLYVTPAGEQISQIHKHYDVEDITQTNDFLVGRCGQQAVDNFYTVLQEYLGLLQE